MAAGETAPIWTSAIHSAFLAQRQPLRLGSVSPVSSQCVLAILPGVSARRPSLRAAERQRCGEAGCRGLSGRRQPRQHAAAGAPPPHQPRVVRAVGAAVRRFLRRHCRGQVAQHAAPAGLMFAVMRWPRCLLTCPANHHLARWAICIRAVKFASSHTHCRRPALGNMLNASYITQTSFAHHTSGRGAGQGAGVDRPPFVSGGAVRVLGGHPGARGQPGRGRGAAGGRQRRPHYPAAAGSQVRAADSGGARLAAVPALGLSSSSCPC